MKYTIFSIDNPTNWHQMAKFMRYIDSLNALQKLKGNVIQCIGFGQNKLEHSFLCLTEDFNTYVAPTSYVDNQSCVLQIPSDRNAESVIVDLLKGTTTSIGVMQQIFKKEVVNHSNWTYRPDLNIYFSTTGAVNCTNGH